MHTLLIILIGYAGLGLITCSIPTSTIDSDATEINKLAHDFRKLSPMVARRLTEKTCEMISVCCPQIRSAFISSVVSGEIQGITEKCFGEKSSSTFLAKILSCPSVTTMTTLVINPQIPKYLSIITKKSDIYKNVPHIIQEVCSDNEMYSLACDWINFDQQDSCERKILQKLAGQGDNKAYESYVQHTKDIYIQINDELKKEFSN